MFRHCINFLFKKGEITGIISLFLTNQRAITLFSLLAVKECNRELIGSCYKHVHSNSQCLGRGHGLRVLPTGIALSSRSNASFAKCSYTACKAKMAVSRAEEFFSQDILEFLLSPTATELESGTAEQPAPQNLPTVPQLGKPTAFVSVTDAEIEMLKDKNTNRNTDKTTSTWARRFQKLQEDRGLCIQPPSQLEPAELDKILQRYSGKKPQNNVVLTGSVLQRRRLQTQQYQG